MSLINNESFGYNFMVVGMIYLKDMTQNVKFGENMWWTK